jgi:hypothetical protein
MASLIDRFRQPREDEPAPPAEAGAAVPHRRRALPPVGQLRRERRNLLRLREQQIRDVGGLVLEMYRQDRFRQDLIYEQAAEIVALEERLREVDELLLAAGNRRAASGPLCRHCSTPLFPGARFCPSCGHAVVVEQA